MFDFGWSELLFIGVICLFIFGPEDIPKIMYNFGRIVRRFRYLRYAMSSQFEDFMEKSEASIKNPQAKPSPSPLKSKEVFDDDESDADAYLMELLPPPPETLPDIEVDLPDDQPDARPKPAPATDGQ